MIETKYILYHLINIDIVTNVNEYTDGGIYSDEKYGTIMVPVNEFDSEEAALECFVKNMGCNDLIPGEDYTIMKIIRFKQEK